MNEIVSTFLSPRLRPAFGHLSTRHVMKSFIVLCQDSSKQFSRKQIKGRPHGIVLSGNFCFSIAIYSIWNIRAHSIQLEGLQTAGMIFVLKPRILLVRYPEYGYIQRGLSFMCMKTCVINELGKLEPPTAHVIFDATL